MSKSSKPSPFYTDRGPEDGPILGADAAGQIDVFSDDGPDWPIGAAIPYAPGASPAGRVEAFRLRVGRDERPGLFVVDRRRLVPLVEWLSDHGGNPAPR